jgi:hypothetical protein
MTAVRFTTICGAALLCASAGCNLAPKHKSQNEDCTTCQTGPVYYYDSNGPMTPNYYPQSPTPVITPQPGPAPAPLPPVPPPPTGSAERPSRVQSMRDATGNFFRSANSNFRSLFSRDDEAIQQ